MKKRYLEADLQKAVCKYIKLQYRDVIFSSEASGLNKGKAAAGIATVLRSGTKLPDLWIPEPRGDYFGLFIEFKAKNPYKLDNTLLSDPHLREQDKMLTRLKKKGYYCDFCWEFQDAKQLIDWYMSKKPTTPFVR